MQFKKQGIQAIHGVLQAILMLGSAAWGYWLGKGDTYLITVVAVYLCLAIIISLLINTVFKLREEIQQERNRISQELFSLKTSGQNNLDITLFPEKGYEFSTTTPSEITVIVNTPNQTDEDFEFLITSDKKIELTIAQGAPIDSSYHFKKYHYHISNSSAVKYGGKYYRLQMNLRPLISNEYYSIEFTAQDSEISGRKLLTFVATG
ncbi:hypothetical protein [Sutcliffiella horikoshii]|uniref:Uncharacterized protein n=1 Tax=Sutcliffiella horikoshii TaxID=79883 RepID=A0A5D4TDY6_9BACI|nr:hypothetical protein [Sutcliffiella horikoshii]TYS72958.1 hypothetical protein FZC75_07780 [Sutcliffiella horikoshii]